VKGIATEVPLWQGASGLSLALDLAMGLRPGHAQAVAALGLAAGRRLGLADPALADLVITAVLKDAG
jgi:HD-GYP domain-containing protein (c-di-GMP phosphodiesterase class II)